MFFVPKIIRWVSDDQPGFVECRFADRLGQEWSVIEKLPVLTDADIPSDSQFPQPGFIACEIVARGQDDAGREIAEITTRNPWAMEATDRTTNFQVHAAQLNKPEQRD